MRAMISAVILSHNDAAVIERVIRSLAWADEILLIDDYSTDTTVELAKKHRVKVYQRHLEDDFAAQRNFGLEKAAGDWIFFVDSDEVVSKALAEEIRKSVEIDCAGFYIKRQDRLFGTPLRHGETARVKLLRLARKDAGLWTRPVHEVWKVTGLTGELTHPLDHFPHPNVAQFIDEINHYSTINATYLYAQKIPVPLWHILAYPAAKFFVDYVWFAGFLDGTAGAVVAIMMSMHSFLTRAKLWLLWHRKE